MFPERFFSIMMSCLAMALPLGHCSEYKSIQKDCPKDQDEEMHACRPYDPSPPLPELLIGKAQPKFVNELPNVVDQEFLFKPVGKTKNEDAVYKIKRKKFVADLGIINPALNTWNNHLYTPVFGFSSKHQEPTYPGRTFIVNFHDTIKVLWENDLINKKSKKPLTELYYVPFDETLPCADLNPVYPMSGVPTVTHLHGGFTKDSSNGHPKAWATPHFVQEGKFLKNREFTYNNEQPAAMLWYHDNAFGFSRLHNYSGLFGSYIIRGRSENRLIEAHKLPSGQYEIPLIIEDKMFTTKGELFFPYANQGILNTCDCISPGIFSGGNALPNPTTFPEFYGDFILVNGKAWPFLKVEPRQYRFRVLNACNSRFLNLELLFPSNVAKTIQFYQIGTDQGLLNEPIAINNFLIAPGQRADIVVDFSKYKDEFITMVNGAKAPFPNGVPADPTAAALIMQFRVQKPLNTKCPRTTLPEKLRECPIERLVPTAPTRKVLLFRGLDEFGRDKYMLGTPDLGGLTWDAPVTEKPILGSTEIWEIYNVTSQALPIHIESGNFQILNRQNFICDIDRDTGVLSNIQFTSDPEPAVKAELGLFDTVIAHSSLRSAQRQEELGPTGGGKVTRIIMNFTSPGSYEWCCSMFSHGDYMMKRPLCIQEKDTE